MGPSASDAIKILKNGIQHLSKHYYLVLGGGLGNHSSMDHYLYYFSLAKIKIGPKYVACGPKTA